MNTLLKNVTISNSRFDYEHPVVLSNGNLVLLFNPKDDLIGAFIVTSFRDEKGEYEGQLANEYCSLVDLNTGYIKFEERCSRRTTVKRVLSHLRHGDYEAKESIKEGFYIEVYNTGNYKINLDLISKQV